MDEILITNAKTALEQVLELRGGENFLVITDETTRVVGEAFREAAARIGANPMFYMLPEVARPLSEIPEDLAGMIPDADLAVTCFKGNAAETPFRIALIRALTEVVRRLGHGPGITEAMLKEGPMSVDYSAMALAAHGLMQRFTGATLVHITAPGGTDIMLDLTDRDFATDTVIPDGKWGNLPAGEIWCAPVETAANGVIVCDASIGDLGQVPSPVRIAVKDGWVTDIECADAAFLKRLLDAMAVDEQAKLIGELGIGLNPGARITGNLLEDEKAGRTAHIAFGNNDDMPGGQNTSRTHRDFLFKRPTFVVNYADGRTAKVLEDGDLVPVQAARGVAGPPIAFKNVLVAVDFSEASRRAIRLADSIARVHGANLHVCHVIQRTVDISPLFPHYVAIPDQDLLRRQEVAVVEKLDEMVAELTGRGPDEFFTWVPSGNPAAEIVNMAEEKGVDLIVLANRGLSELARMLIGSVAESVVRHAHCTVLLSR